MNLFSFVLVTLSMLFVSTPPDSFVLDSAPEIYIDLPEATVGINPQTGEPSGWYTSNVTIQILSPAEATANGKPLVDGRFALSEEGQHQVEFQPGLFGQANAVTQYVSIDRFPPQIAWLTGPNATISGDDSLSAEITDPTSGICAVETSFDNGRTWASQFFPAPLPGRPGIVHEATWSRHLVLGDFSRGEHVILLRAHDCAGNTSPGKRLAFQVQ